MNSLFYFEKPPLMFYCVRYFTHLFVLLALVFHQFLFIDFIDPNLAIFGYSLCFLILLMDSLFLFFNNPTQTKNFEMLFLFFDALFLTAFLVLAPVSIMYFLIFFLICINVFTLVFLKQFYSALIFTLYLLALFPVSLVINNQFEHRLSLVLLNFSALFGLLLFSCLFYFMATFTSSKRNLQLHSKEDSDFFDTSFSFDKKLSLDFVRTMKPVLNSFLNPFLDEHKNKQGVFNPVFSSEQEKKQLISFKQFLTDFIDYVEMNQKLLDIKADIDLEKLLNELLQELQTHQKRPEGLKQTVDFQGKIYLKASSIHLKKAFKNILINSYEALSDQEKACVSIQVYTNKSEAVIRFTDNGQGIEEEDYKKVFDPFFSKRLGLRGLGLSYAYQVVKAHKGDISIEKNQNSEVQVYVRLPLQLYEKPKSVKKTSFKQTG